MQEWNAELGLTRDNVHPWKYAIFPGMENLKERIIYAKVANRWDDFSANFELRFSRILRAPSSTHQMEEPVAVAVVRTDEGGLRRVNDFRPRGPKNGD